MQTDQTIKRFSRVLNLHKSVLELTHHLEYSGLILDMVQDRFSFPPKERSSSCVQIWTLGLNVISFEAVQFTQFHSRPLQHNILSSYAKWFSGLVAQESSFGMREILPSSNLETVNNRCQPERMGRRPRQLVSAEVTGGISPLDQDHRWGEIGYGCVGLQV